MVKQQYLVGSPNDFGFGVSSLITISFFLLCSLINLNTQAQSNEINRFLLELEALDSDSALKVLDEKLISIPETKSDTLERIETLKYKFKLADSLDHWIHQYNSSNSLLNYEGYLEKKELYKYLQKSAEGRLKISEFGKALSLKLRALEIAEMLEIDSLIIMTTISIADNFIESGDSSLAEKYSIKALIQAKQLNNLSVLASAFVCRGNVMANVNKFDEAYDNYERSLEINIQLRQKSGMASNYNNLANLCFEKEKYDEAILLYNKAFNINKADGNKHGQAYNLSNIALIHFFKKNYTKAIHSSQKALDLYSELGETRRIVHTLENLGTMYAEMGDYEQGFETFYLAYEKGKDHYQEERINFAAELEAKFQNEKNELQIQKLKAEQIIQENVLQNRERDLDFEKQLRIRDRNLIYTLGVLLFCLVVIIFGFWRNSRERKRHNAELMAKNNEIRIVNDDLNKTQVILKKKNKEITDSINYAKRIQVAILPSKAHVKDHLKQSFVLYIPKDIVSGDFYWTEQVGDNVLFAVADCTGHGVPGAMVSVICYTALNKIIGEERLTDPGQILDLTTDEVIRQFEKSEEEVKDGMDVALCSYNLKTKTLKYAGANIPLWVVRDNEVIEYKASRQPVGGYLKRQKFMTHNVDLLESDTVYLSSDGFADQFGGVKGKKFMKKHLKSLLVRVKEESLNTQFEFLKSSFIEWKASNEQVDDICIMGIKFNK